MNFRSFVLFFALIILTLSCKKEEPIVNDVPEEEYQSAIYHLDSETKWSFEVEYVALDWPSGGWFFRNQSVTYVDSDTNLLTATVHSPTDIESPTYKDYFVLRYYVDYQRWDNEEAMDTAPPSSVAHYTGFSMRIRQDIENRKVYVINVPEWEVHDSLTHYYEFLLYDFNLEPGDEVPYNKWTPEPEGNTIVDVFFEKHDGKLIKKYKVKNNGPNPSIYYYSEFIGGLARLSSYDPHSRLTRFENQNVVINF
jgi:hypothetical protein